MRWRVGKIPLVNLIILAFFSVIIYMYCEKNKFFERTKYYSEKMKSAQLMNILTITIKEKKESMGIVIDEINDPNKTGLIGPEYSLITTDRGDLVSKLTATNPNFAAIIVEMLKRCGLKKGDIVAIGETGSLVGLNLAVYSAMEILELKPIIISSVGASCWGATDTNFTWLDMVHTLYNKKLIRFKPVAASIGGGGDIGRGLSPRGRELIRDAIKRNKITLIEERTLEESINKRMEIYDKMSKGKKIKAYINIGGGLASLGSAQNYKLIPSGVSKRLAAKNFPKEGVIIKMAKRGIPIINLHNVRDIAQKYNLSINPIPLPAIGEGEIFFKERYSISATIVSIIILAVLAFIFLRIEIWSYILRRR